MGSAKRPKIKLQLVTTTNEPSALEQETLSAFRKGVPRVIPNFTHRPLQQEMAQLAARAIYNRHILLAEAGVGIGKSMAYLIPLLFGKKHKPYPRGPIIVSTKTIALQEQLYRKDVPQAFRAAGIDDIDFLLCKGKSNYVCLHNLNSNMPHSNEELGGLWEKIRDWAEHSRTGDRAEEGAPGIPEEIWARIHVDECNKRTCLYEDKCAFVIHKRLRRNASGIIICNHDLFITDLILRQQGKALWAPPTAVVIDEAHALEDITRRELTKTLKKSRLPRLLRGITNNHHVSQFVKSSLLDELDVLWNRFEELLMRCVDWQGEGETDKFRVRPDNFLLLLAAQLQEKIASLENRIDIALGSVDERGKGKIIVQRAERLLAEASDLKYIFGGFLERGGRVFWVEKHGKDWFLSVAPISINSFLSEMLWQTKERYIPIILSSGTLAIRGDFNFIEDRLGIRRETLHFSAASPFNYRERTVIYVPRDLPSPSHDVAEDQAFVEAITNRIADILTITRGKALVLFTSHRRMNAVYEKLAGKGVPWPLLRQGQNPAGLLLQRFREDIDSVLLATGSFWEGVDVVGESLSAVIMDKLPFPSPFDPLVQAMREKLEASGLDPHQNLNIPEMLSNLRQGAGRLIRHENDRGIIAILDWRAAKQYASLVKEALPPGKWVHQLREVREWWKEDISGQGCATC